MKRLHKLTLLVVVLLISSVATYAQKSRSLDLSDTDATVKAINKIMPKYSGRPELNQFIDDICAKNKKNPNLCTGIANAYWYLSGVRDSTNAFKYVNKALEVNPKYAPAYQLLGEIWWNLEDSTKAIGYYTKAIEVDPTYVKAYDYIINIKRYEDREGTIALIKKMGESIPNYPVNLKIANTYVNSTIGRDLQTAKDYYAIAERDSMEARDFQNEASLYYALASSSTGVEKLNSYLKMLEIGEEGLSRYPQSFELLNVALIGATNSHNNPDTEQRAINDNKAVKYGELLLQAPGADTLIQSNHYQLYAQALMNKGAYEKAISTFKALLDNPNTTDDIRNFAIGKIADAYAKLGEYDKADKEYQTYLATLEKNGNADFYYWHNYAQMYVTKSEECVGQEKQNALQKAVDIYEEASKKFVGNATYCYWTEVRLLLDDVFGGVESGRFVGPANRLCNMMQTKQNLDENDKYYWAKTSYYLAYYYYKVKNNAKVAKPYWQKVYELEPDNETAKNVLKNQYKMSL